MDKTQIKEIDRIVNLYKLDLINKGEARGMLVMAKVVMPTGYTPCPDSTNCTDCKDQCGKLDPNAVNMRDQAAIRKTLQSIKQEIKTALF